MSTIYLVQGDRGALLNQSGGWTMPGTGVCAYFRERAEAHGAAAHYGGRVVEVEEPTPVARMLSSVSAAPTDALGLRAVD